MYTLRIFLHRFMLLMLQTVATSVEDVRQNRFRFNLGQFIKLTKFGSLFKGANDMR